MSDEKHPVEPWTFKAPKENVRVTTVAGVDGWHQWGEYKKYAKKGETLVFEGPAETIYGHGLKVYPDLKDSSG